MELYLIELICKLADIRTPITTAQGLQLANSIVKGTSIEQKVIGWKQMNCKGFQLGHAKAELGKDYWLQFLKRNNHLIRLKKAVKIDVKRALWCTYLNMQEMYNEIYKDLFSAGLACEHPEPIWRNEHEEVVEKAGDTLAVSPSMS